MRQSMTNVKFQQSTRRHHQKLLSSGRAGKVYPIADVMLLPGDSCGGSLTAEFKLAEMPKPLINGVSVLVESWFVPWSVFPQFVGMDDFNAALTGQAIKRLGVDDYAAPELFNVLTDSAEKSDLDSSEFARFMGKHFPSNAPINTNSIDAFWQVYNYRLASMSDRLPLHQYAAEDLDEALTLPRAIWPTSRITRIVPDYDQAQLLGGMDLDLSAGSLPISGLTAGAGASGGLSSTPFQDATGVIPAQTGYEANNQTSSDRLFVAMDGAIPAIYAEMVGQRMTTTLADLDMARGTQAFGKLAESMAGMDTSGYSNDDMLVAMMMSGLMVPESQFKRPWKIGAQRANFVLNERHATDAANLDESVSVGGAVVRVPMNVPKTMTGGYIIVTGEVLPDRIDERFTDEAWLLSQRQQLPNALADAQRVEPVDAVPNRRIDARHTAPDAQYGWEGMNDRWNVERTAMGGEYYQETPGSMNTAARSQLWIPEYVDPAYTDSHWLAPDDFPHDVFSVTTASAWDISAEHDLRIVGNTQIGDVLAEDNGSFEYVQGAKDRGYI